MFLQVKEYQPMVYLVNNGNSSPDKRKDSGELLSIYVVNKLLQA